MEIPGWASRWVLGGKDGWMEETMDGWRCSEPVIQIGQAGGAAQHGTGSAWYWQGLHDAWVARSTACPEHLWDLNESKSGPSCCRTLHLETNASPPRGRAPGQVPALPSPADLCISYTYLSQENKTSTHTDTQTPLSCLYMTPDFAYCSDYLTIFPL